jgi:hypothetical protein
MAGAVEAFIAHSVQTLAVLVDQLVGSASRGDTVMVKRRELLVGLTGACVTGALSSVARAQTIRTEAAHHPRIAKAIEELEEAIRYLEAAPHDFGGHKVKAIADSRAAVRQLRLALAYRAMEDRKR